ncbi:MAG: TonB-dependent receptor [Acidobacteria bacterium]|nr:TonB-dependent receptor [Acidobacteriota bacterium]
MMDYQCDKTSQGFASLVVIFTVGLVFFGWSTRLLAQGGQESGSRQQGRNNNQATANQERQSSGSAASRIDESQLVGLPLNGRSYNQLVTLEAGISNTSSESASRGIGGGSINVSGSRGTSNVFLMDGTNVMDIDNQSPQSAAGVRLGSDSVLQVQVFGTNYSAEYGRGSGGVLNSITRSGTPQLHGTVFEYFRNSKLDARNFFDGVEPPPFKRNQFGFTLTGPILKERTFFLLSFEALRDRLNSTDVSAFPDREARLGKITDCAGKVLIDLNQEGGIPVKVKPYLALYPLPNYDCLGGGIGENREPFFQPSDDEFAVIRLDHQFSLRDSLFLRYTFDDARSTGGGSTFLFQRNSNSRQQYLTLVETHIFSASTINSFRFGYTRPTGDSANVSQIVIPREMYFIPDAPDFGQMMIPRVSAFGNPNGGPSAEVFNTFQFADDMVLQRGQHTAKFGIQVHRYRAYAFSNINRGGAWSFNGLESFLRGGPEGTTLTGVLPGSDNSRRWRQTVQGLYVNDSYAVRSNLRLDLGLRYEYATLIRDKHGKSIFVADPLRDTGPSPGPPLDHNPTHNFSPRLGISWSPGGRRDTTVRTGFGIYYDPLLTYVVLNQKGTAPFYKKTVRTNFNASGQEKDENGNLVPLPYAFPDAVATLKDLPLQSQVMDYHNFTTSMAIRYEVEIQKDLPGGWSSRLSYAGNRGNHLYRRYEYNLYPFPEIRSDGTLFFPPDCAQLPKNSPAEEFALCRPNVSLGMNSAFGGGLNYLVSDVQSFYNSFRLAANKRFDSGTTLQVSYTLAKSVDDGGAGGSNIGGGGEQYPHMRTMDRALSDFDSRQQLTINYLYPFPLGRGRQWLNSGFLSNFLGGWRLGGIVRFRTGTPLSPGLNVRKTGYLFEATRPNVAPGQSNRPAVKGTTAGCGNGAIKAGEELGTSRRYFDPCIYEFPTPGTVGNAGRNTIQGPRLITTDVSLQREFPLGGDRRLQFRTEIFNLFNHTNFSGPTGGSNSAVFSGIPNRYNLSVGRLTRTATTSRQMQFALRLSF